MIEVKSLDLVRYVAHLARAAWSPELFLRLRPRDHVFRLMHEVWPAEGESLRWTMRCLFAIGLLRSLLLYHSTNLLKRLVPALYGEKSTSLLRLESLFVRGVVLALCAGLQHAAQQFLSTRLHIEFRARLVSKVHELYFSRRRYYRLTQEQTRIQNPQDLVTTELNSIASRLSVFVSTLLLSLPQLGTLSLRLFASYGPWLALFPQAYLLLMYELAQRAFPKNVGQLHRESAIASSNYRSACTRLQQNAEGVGCVVGGAVREKQILEDYFDVCLSKETVLARTARKFVWILMLFPSAFTFTYSFF
ncbi:unnamed protein product [Amoebophrya sp. A25]|nr:unnamed protein product [Amoebophrya sp. A25]|eukprot:GSA25T00027019001.1